mgnify:CR=1 FL=1
MRPRRIIAPAQAAPPPDPSAPPPPASSLLKLSSKSLGIVFSNDVAAAYRHLPGPLPPPPHPPVDWPAKADKISRLLQLMSRVRSLSAFGRSCAASGYAMSTGFYHAEHGGLPGAATLSKIEAKRARLVDGRWRYANGHTTRITGVPSALQAGHPEEGGLGALPMAQHVKARWARWAVRLASSGSVDAADAVPWWIRIARALIAEKQPWRRLRFSPSLLWRECGKQPAQGQADTWLLWSGGRPRSPSALARLVDGLRALPPVELVGEVPDPGPWCAGMPLWGNVLLERRARLSPSDGASFTGAFIHVGELTAGAIATVGDALDWQWRLRLPHPWGQHSRDGTPWSRMVRRFFDPFPVPGHLDYDGGRERLRRALPPLLAALPAGWETAALAAMTSRTPMRTLRAEAEGIIARAVGWHTRSVVVRPPTAAPAGAPSGAAAAAGALPPPAGAATAAAAAATVVLEDNLESVLLASKLTVKAATSLQLHPVRQRRARLHALFVEEALAGSTGAAPSVHDAFPAMQLRLKDAWRLHWENKHKVIFWRIAMDAVQHFNNAATRRRRRGAAPDPATDADDSPPPSPAAGPSGATAGQADAAHVALAQPAAAGPSGAAQAAAPRYDCYCGSGECSRAHHFHACPVARAVFACLQAALPAGTPSIQRWHVWLAEPPAGAGLHSGVWLVVCLAALTAMDVGRRRLAAEHLRRAAERAASDGLRQTQVTEHFPPATGGPPQPPPPPPPPPLEVAKARSVAEFWSLMQNFAEKGLPERTTRAWRAAGVGPTHPFLGVVGDPPRVRLVGAPPEATVPGDGDEIADE